MKNRIKTIKSTLFYFYKYGIPSYIIAFGESLGDNLLLTVLSRELNRRKHKNIWVKSNQQQLFEHNPNIKLILPFGALLSGLLLKAFKVKTVFPKYTVYHPETDSDEIPEKHIVLKMADDLQIKGKIDLKPVLILTANELEAAQWAKSHIVITTSGSAALFPMDNKEWDVKKYQQVVDLLCQTHKFIQLGSQTDAPLKNVIDLRGKTTIRQTAAILSNAALLVSHVGFMMHLARSVDCRSVIIYGGRERPDQSGYISFKNVYSAVECSPCWLHNTCHYDKKCMQMILPGTVEAAIIEQLALINEPLPADILYNG